ncbi:MAG: RsmB/NOP family class I SAM-dependent RNA methyltransferase [Coriobacteriales bacterium]|jgi:16S rRNA (cytosine967-C5)-methyltransferase
MADLQKGKRKGRRGKPRSAATPARLLARELLQEQRVRDAYLRELVDARRETSTIAAEEFAFAQVLAFGVVMTRGTLDELIDRNLESPHDVHAKLRDCLRISAYELLFLDKPAPVVVDQGVELARSCEPRAAGLTNAVLHKMARDAQGFPWGDTADSDAAFARSFGMPVWLCERLISQYGRERAAQMLSACLKPAPAYLVDNLYPGGGQFASDLSAQKVASLVPLDEPVLEVGAGRGTKTALLEGRALREFGHPISIYAVDVHEFKAHLLDERMGKMGIEGVHALTADARDLSGVSELPDSVSVAFVDAPCSGTGTLRRHPEIRWKLAPEGVDDLSELQLSLLKGAAARVAVGGTLVYATCSILDEENQQVVDAFLASEEGSGFSVAPLNPEFATEEDAWAVSAKGAFVALPREGGPDGHFAVRLVRNR